MHKLFSIKCKYSDKIYAKEKFVEFRRQNVNVKQNEKCLIYTSSPVMRITGYFIVEEKVRMSLNKLWNRTMKIAGITKAEFTEYFKGCEEGTAIIFKVIKRFINGLSLEEIRKKVKGFVPPQSYYNINEPLYTFIRKSLDIGR